MPCSCLLQKALSPLRLSKRNTLADQVAWVRHRRSRRLQSERASGSIEVRRPRRHSESLLTVRHLFPDVPLCLPTARNAAKRETYVTRRCRLENDLSIIALLAGRDLRQRIGTKAGWHKSRMAQKNGIPLPYSNLKSTCRNHTSHQTRGRQVQQIEKNKCLPNFQPAAKITHNQPFRRDKWVERRRPGTVKKKSTGGGT